MCESVSSSCKLAHGESLQDKFVHTVKICQQRCLAGCVVRPCQPGLYFGRPSFKWWCTRERENLCESRDGNVERLHSLQPHKGPQQLRTFALLETEISLQNMPTQTRSPRSSIQYIDNFTQSSLVLIAGTRSSTLSHLRSTPFQECMHQVVLTFWNGKRHLVSWTAQQNIFGKLSGVQISWAKTRSKESESLRPRPAASRWRTMCCSGTCSQLKLLGRLNSYAAYCKLNIFEDERRPWKDGHRLEIDGFDITSGQLCFQRIWKNMSKQL